MTEQTATKEEVAESTTEEQLKSLILEMAAANGTELTPDQITLTTTDWNELISDEGKIETDDGNEYITLAELRRLARLRGYHSSRPNVVQVPEFENRKHATVEWEIVWRDGIVDGACACASRSTINDGFRNFTVAIASNRAEARCIRAALGINTCSYEEIGPDDASGEDEYATEAATDQQKKAITMLVSRHKITNIAEILGEELTATLPLSGDHLDLSQISNKQAVKVLAALNKYKGKK